MDDRDILRSWFIQEYDIIQRWECLYVIVWRHEACFVLFHTKWFSHIIFPRHVYIYKIGTVIGTWCSFQANPKFLSFDHMMFMKYVFYPNFILNVRLQDSVLLLTWKFVLPISPDCSPSQKLRVILPSYGGIIWKKEKQTKTENPKTKNMYVVYGDAVMKRYDFWLDNQVLDSFGGR